MAKFFERLLCCRRLTLCFKDHAPIRRGKYRTSSWFSTLRTNFGQRRDFVFSRHLLCNSSIPDHTISKLCELCRGDRHKFAFVQNDAPCSANELPPLSCRA